MTKQTRATAMDGRAFRANVAALVRTEGKILACYRAQHPGWQCVQGGYDPEDDTPENAILRELSEELGVPAAEFRIVYRSPYWRRYLFPRGFDKKGMASKYAGQDQLWFDVELSNSKYIDLEKACGEFSKIQLMSIEDFIASYVEWKKAPFLDFCMERNLGR